MEHRVRGARVARRFEQRRVAFAQRAAHARSVDGRECGPDQAAAPVEQIAVRRERREHARRVRRRHGDSPDDGPRREHGRAADRGPERARFVRTKRRDLSTRRRRLSRRAGCARLGAPDAAQQARERSLARVDRCREALEPQHAATLGVERRRRHVVRRAERGAHHEQGVVGRRARHDERALGLGLRRHTQRNRSEHRERAPRAREQLRHVVARHVLHDAAAGFETLAASRDGLAAEEVIARRAGRHAPRAREVRGEHAADRARPRDAEQRAEVRRLEREALRARRELPLDHRERRRGERGQHELLRLVCDDAVERVEREDVRVDLAPDAAERAPADRLERAPMRRDDLGDVGCVARPQRSRCDGARRGCARGAQNLGRSGKRSDPECTCSRPCSAQRRNVGNTLPGLKRTSGSNACLMPVLHFEVGVRELVRHQVALLDSDAVLAREHAAAVDAELQDLGAERLGAIELAWNVGVVEDQGMQVAVARVEHVRDAQPKALRHLGDRAEHARQLAARNRAVHAVVVGADPADGRERRLAAGPEREPLALTG